MKGDTQVAMAICFFFVGAYIGAVIERDVFPTCDGLIVGVAMGLFTGVVAGIYSGVVVTRMAQFEELRNQIKRIALGFEYIYSGNARPEIRGGEKIPGILYAASDLTALKHRDAGVLARWSAPRISDHWLVEDNKPVEDI